jgi:hypothetical protein
VREPGGHAAEDRRELLGSVHVRHQVEQAARDVQLAAGEAREPRLLDAEPVRLLGRRER